MAATIQQALFFNLIVKVQIRIDDALFSKRQILCELSSIGGKYRTRTASRCVEDHPMRCSQLLNAFLADNGRRMQGKGLRFHRIYT